MNDGALVIDRGPVPPRLTEPNPTLPDPCSAQGHQTIPGGPNAQHRALLPTRGATDLSPQPLRRFNSETAETLFCSKKSNECSFDFFEQNKLSDDVQLKSAFSSYGSSHGVKKTADNGQQNT